eukprot:13421128-Heterocapsa_arctica.AAC.1
MNHAGTHTPGHMKMITRTAMSPRLSPCVTRAAVAGCILRKLAARPMHLCPSSSKAPAMCSYFASASVLVARLALRAIADQHVSLKASPPCQGVLCLLTSSTGGSSELACSGNTSELTCSGNYSSSRGHTTSPYMLSTSI